MTEQPTWGLMQGKTWGDLAGPDDPAIDDPYVKTVEQALNEMRADLETLRARVLACESRLMNGPWPYVPIERGTGEHS